MKKENLEQTLEALKSIMTFPNLKFSRNKYDFFTDRLRVAATQRNLLATIIKFGELLDTPIVYTDTVTGILKSSASEDAEEMLQVIREMPQIMIAMAKSKKEIMAEQIEEFLKSYIPPALEKNILKPRNGFDIKLNVTITQALAHGDDTRSGNCQMFRRCSVLGGLRLPFYSGNAIGGAMRDLLADHFLDSLGITTDKAKPGVELWFFHILYSGGIMAENAIPKEFEKMLYGAGGSAIKSSGIRQLRDMLPFFSMLGGVGKSPMEGYIYINDLRPLCKEWGTGDKSYHDLLTWRFIARRDDFEGRTSKAQNDKEEEVITANTYNTSMLANTECLCEGAKLEGGIDVSNHISELELSALACGLNLLKKYGYLGGKKHRGYGKVEIEIETEKLLNSTLYEDYLKNNKNVILQYLKDIAALTQGEVCTQLI